MFGKITARKSNIELKNVDFHMMLTNIYDKYYQKCTWKI